MPATKQDYYQLLGVSRGASEKDIRQALSETVVKSGWSLLELDTLEITLEDIFLQLTSERKEGAKVA